MKNGVVIPGSGQNIFIYVEDHQKEAVLSAFKAVEGVYIDSVESQGGTIETYTDLAKPQEVATRDVPAGDVKIGATNTCNVPLKKIQHVVDVALAEGRNLEMIEVLSYEWDFFDGKLAENTHHISPNKVTKERFLERSANGPYKNYQIVAGSEELVPREFVVEDTYHPELRR